MSWWKWASKPAVKKPESYIITPKDIIYSPLSPSEFFKANHDELHLGHMTWHAMIQLQIGLMDQMADMIDKQNDKDK